MIDGFYTEKIVAAEFFYGHGNKNTNHHDGKNSIEGAEKNRVASVFVGLQDIGD